MTSHPAEKKSHANGEQRPSSAAGGGDQDPILCNHCGRTASNGIRCLGMCVADSEY
ncbi:hypothetical protein WH7805_06796 [Synechococcus sp. WH 7805]|uniref:hypothetical protein n=1 Tax=Synechococcus sp. WH 8017 TaxID=166321 RepID=UPI00006B3D88|nr:hypothetical protein WH7805_06796 [Synechococcus sp. WH 7805]